MLNGVDFQVPGVTDRYPGPSTCGKSTTLKALARVNPLKEGGAPGWHAAAADEVPGHRQRFWRYSRGPRAPSGVTVADVVARGRYPHNRCCVPGPGRDGRACVEAMRPRTSWNLRASGEALSGGQRQRVWIAMTSRSRPR